MAGMPDLSAGYILATIVLADAEQPDGGGVRASHYLAQASLLDLAMAQNCLGQWGMSGLPPMDVEDGEDPPETDDEYIAYQVEQAEAAAAIANAMSRIYDTGLAGDKQLGVIDYPEPTDAAAEAVLEIEHWRQTCWAAFRLVSAEMKKRRPEGAA